MVAMSLTVFVVDDHEATRYGTRVFLERSGILLCGEADTAEGALSDPAVFQANVVLTDIRLPGSDGLTLLAQLRELEPAIRVILYTGYDNPTYFARARALGAMGLILKSDPLGLLIDALQNVARGGDCWDREQRRRHAISHSLRPTHGLAADNEVALTHRETDVLIHLANGLSNKEIALTLGIGYETVKEHVQHVLRKLGVTDRTQAAVWAVRQQLV